MCTLMCMACVWHVQVGLRFTVEGGATGTATLAFGVRPGRVVDRAGNAIVASMYPFDAGVGGLVCS